MEPITWYLALFISAPQIIVVILLGFSLFNMKIDYYKTFIVALIMGVICYFLRFLSVPLAINTFSIIFCTSALTWLICKKNFIDSLLAVLLGVMLYGVMETFILQMCFCFTDYTTADLLTNALLNIVLFMLTLPLVLGLYYLIKKLNIVIYDLELKEQLSE